MFEGLAAAVREMSAQMQRAARMIYGIGVDVLQHERIDALPPALRRAFRRPACCCRRSARSSNARRVRPRFLAMRFAAKEAIVKAMGTGFAHGMWIRDVGVVQNRLRQARRSSGRSVASACAASSASATGHVTLTDEAGLVVAVAML